MQGNTRRFQLIFLVAAIRVVTAGPATGAEPSAANSLAATNVHAATAALLLKFNRNAWSAQKAHDEAVKFGPAILPELIAAASERPRPGYARMWLVTAIADIPDPQSAAALRTLLDDPEEDVRCVAGYYGPRQKSAPLDQAIAAVAATTHNARFTSYALLGFLVFRGEAPEGLLAAGLENGDPRARAAAARSLATMASDQSKSRLQALLQDKDNRVRTTARKVLDAMQPAKQDPPAPGR